MSAMRSSDRSGAMSRTLQGPGVVWLPLEGVGALTGVVGDAFDLVLGREAVEHGVDHLPRLLRARRVAEHDRQEVVGAQRVEPQVAAPGTHGRRPSDAPQQCYLAEPLPRTEPRD